MIKINVTREPLLPDGELALVFDEKEITVYVPFPNEGKDLTSHLLLIGIAEILKSNLGQRLLLSIANQALASLDNEEYE